MYPYGHMPEYLQSFKCNKITEKKPFKLGTSRTMHSVLRSIHERFLMIIMVLPFNDGREVEHPLGRLLLTGKDSRRVDQANAGFQIRRIYVTRLKTI